MSTDRLHRLLADRFTAGDLQQLVAFDDALAAARLAVAVNFNQSNDQVAFALVQAAEARGLLPTLATAALRARPLVPEAQEVAALFGVAGHGPAVADPNQVRYAVGQFNQAFLDRRRLLGRLETYKGLHDILHQLQASHGELARLVKAAREPGYDPLDAGDMPDTLTAWLTTADLPNRPPRWVPEFVRAARLVARCINGEPVPPADADRELALLGKLPADEQADLNERLVEAARDLDVDGLEAPLRTLRAALGPAHGAEFQQRYDQFRLNCDALRHLIDDHDRCQAVDAALAEAGVLLRQPTAVSPGWDGIRTRFTHLSTTRPGNAAVGRLIRMVDRLAAAGPAARPDWLPDLQAGFGQFFFDLDSELLDATDRVIHTADVLDFRLRGYSQ